VGKGKSKSDVGLILVSGKCFGEGRTRKNGAYASWRGGGIWKSSKQPGRANPNQKNKPVEELLIGTDHEQVATTGKSRERYLALEKVPYCVKKPVGNQFLE